MTKTPTEEDFARLQAERDRAVEALGPFADACEGGDDGHVRDDGCAWESPMAMAVTYGDFRRAAAVVSTLPPPALQARPTFEDWLSTLEEDVVEGEYGYEPGEFTVFPEHWRQAWEDGLTPSAAFRRACEAATESRKAQEAVDAANALRIKAEDRAAIAESALQARVEALEAENALLEAAVMGHQRCRDVGLLNLTDEEVGRINDAHKKAVETIRARAALTGGRDDG